MLRKKKILQSLKISWASSLVVIFAGCPGKPPKWDGKLWAADSSDQTIKRAQENQAIKCSDPAFDDYICMSYADFKLFYNTYVLGCKKWAVQGNWSQAELMQLLSDPVMSKMLLSQGGKY